MAEFNPRRTPVNVAIHAAAKKLLDRDFARIFSGDWLETLFSNDDSWLRSADTVRLRNIISGKLKTVDVQWWLALHRKANDERDQVATMADPARNPNEHERKVAAAKLAGLRPKAAPGLEEYVRQLREYNRQQAALKAARDQRQAAREARFQATIDRVVNAARDVVNTTSPANTTKKPRSAARNTARAAERAKAREGLVCLQCGKPLDAKRPTARYCGPTCRSHAFRGKPPTRR
jgi:hypothetical protein